MNDGEYLEEDGRQKAHEKQKPCRIQEHKQRDKSRNIEGQ